jgi:hypothetical protein
MSDETLNVLLLSHVKPGFANTVFDHQDALSRLSRHNVAIVDPLDHPGVVPDMSAFDVAIVHYSIICFSPDYLSLPYRRALQDFRGLKVLFIQDEYRTVWAATEAMTQLGIDLLFTCVPAAAVEPLYGELARRGVRIEATLTGYVPDDLVGKPFRPLADRPLDAVYRGRPLPFSLGRLATEKVEIARRFRELAPLHGLLHDVDWREENRIYGHSWNEFLASGRCALGTESGASICDFTGDIDRAVRLFAQQRPDAGYEEAAAEVVGPYEGNVVINTISPRAFEAIALGTALVQFPGDYSGILVPERHYVVLEKDFSNFAEVADAMRDLDRLERMRRAAYDDVIGSGRWSYRAFAAHVDDIVHEEWLRRVRREAVPAPPYLARVLGGVPPAPARPGDEDELLERVASSLYDLPPENWAQAHHGARIAGDSGFFERPHDADCLLRPARPDVYAAALPDSGRPQWLEIDLGREREVWGLRFQGYSDELRCTAFSFEGRADRAQPWSLLAEESAFGGVDWACRLGGRPLRWIRFTAWEFSGQQRILLRGLQVLGPDPVRPGRAPRVPAPRSATVRDLLQPGAGAAVIGSSAFFGAPHDAASLLDPGAGSDGYAAALADAPLPHWIEFDLGERSRIDRVRLVWYSEQERCTAFALLGRERPDDPWTALADVEDRTGSCAAIELGGATARYLRLEARAFAGQPRLLLRRVAVFGSPQLSGQVPSASAARSSESAEL